MNPKDNAKLVYEISENKSARDEDKVLRNFKKILIRNKESYLAPAIGKEFTKIQEEKEREKITYISSASKLTVGQRKELERIAAEPREFSVNPNLLGGVAVRVGDSVYNATVRKKLETLNANTI